MIGLTITCASCGQGWLVANSFSVYEQQAVESCPCPQCGAYTLCCREAADNQGGGHVRHAAHGLPVAGMKGL